jgi:putative PIN family toxin of toxin-antitoxin system
VSVFLARVVIDINVLVSAYFFSGQDSPPRKVLEAALDKRFRLLHTPVYLADLRRVLNKDKFKERLARTGSNVDMLVETIALLGDTVESGEVPLDAVRDKDDVIILACAAGGRAAHIVTGDDDLLTLGEYDGITICTPAQFLTILNDYLPGETSTS